jgi:hypothetical protein
LLIENKIRYLSLRLLSRNFIEEGIAQEASGKNGLFEQRNDFSLDKFLELKRRFVLRNSHNAILGPLGGKSSASSQDHPTLLSSQFDQRVSTLTPIIKDIVSQHPQFLCQLSKVSVRDKLHSLELMVHALAKNPKNGPRPGWTSTGRHCVSLYVFPDDRLEIFLRFIGYKLLAGDQGIF